MQCHRTVQIIISHLKYRCLKMFINLLFILNWYLLVYFYVRLFATALDTLYKLCNPNIFKIKMAYPPLPRSNANACSKTERSQSQCWPQSFRADLCTCSALLIDGTNQIIHALFVSSLLKTPLCLNYIIDPLYIKLFLSRFLKS